MSEVEVAEPIRIVSVCIGAIQIATTDLCIPDEFCAFHTQYMIGPMLFWHVRGVLSEDRTQGKSNLWHLNRNRYCLPEEGKPKNQQYVH
jgi:hypothetical protein